MVKTEILLVGLSRFIARIDLAWASLDANFAPLPHESACFFFDIIIYNVVEVFANTYFNLPVITDSYYSCPY
jgi:hypothetical protein